MREQPESHLLEETQSLARDDLSKMNVCRSVVLITHHVPPALVFIFHLCQALK